MLAKISTNKVISDVLLVLLTIGSLAAGEPFPVVFIPAFTTRSLLEGQDLLSVLCMFFFMVGYRPYCLFSIREGLGTSL